MTRVRVEPRSFAWGRCKNDAFTLSATLQIQKNLCAETSKIQTNKLNFTLQNTPFFPRVTEEAWQK